MSHGSKLSGGYIELYRVPIKGLLGCIEGMLPMAHILYGFRDCIPALPSPQKLKLSQASWGVPGALDLHDPPTQGVGHAPGTLPHMLA